MKKLKITLSSLLLLIATNTLFSQTYNADDDEVDFYVPGILANDAMQQVNFLLCFMKNTNFESFIDKGVYKALVDEAQCQSASGLDAASEALQATGGSAETGTSAVNETDTINYTTAVMQPSSSGSEYLGKGWVSLNFDVGGSDQNLTAYVKVNIRARADSSNRFGSFTMRYDIRNEAAIGAPLNVDANTSIEKGYLDVTNNVIKYRQSGVEDPPRAIEVDFNDLNNIQGILQTVLESGAGEPQPTHALFHQIHVNEGSNLYCQKFLAARTVSLGVDANNVPEWSVSNDDVAGFDPAGLTNVGTDGGNSGSIIGSHCWDLRKSEAKRIVYEYGTYLPSAGNTARKDLATPSLSLEAKSTTDPANAALANTPPIWIHASHWGVHVDQNRRGDVTDAIVFKNTRNDNDATKYSLRKNYYEIQKLSREQISLNSLDKISFQTNISWLAREGSPFRTAIQNLGFPVGDGFGIGNCNSSNTPVLVQCPEFAGYISVSAGTVTFHVTDAMSWGSNRQLPFKLPTPFTFTAAEWVTQMSVNNNNAGMWFHDPDAHQGYWVPFSAFQNVASNNVVTNIQQKISMAELKADIENPATNAGATGLICIERCLGYDELNATLAEAFTDMGGATPDPSSALSSPYLDIGAYLKNDSYFDDNPTDDQRNIGADPANPDEVLFVKGRHNFIGGVKKGEAGKYVVALDNGELKIKEDMATYTPAQNNFIEYTGSDTAGNKLAVNQRSHNDGLRDYRHKTKPVGYTVNDYNRHLGYAFTMDVVIDSTQNILDLYCPLDGTLQNASGYSALLKTDPGGASVHATGTQEYYCDYKFNEIPVRYEIRLKQMPVYTLVDSEDANETPISISEPVTLEYTVPANTVYNFSNLELTGDATKNLEGRKFKMKFEGFGNLYNIPGRVVNVCNETIVGKYTDNWLPCYRYVHDFIIPDGAILKDTSGADYLKVKALKGDEYLKKIVSNYDAYSKEITDVPGDNNLLDIYTDIGAKPAISHPAANSEKAAVVHGVTVIAAP